MVTGAGQDGERVEVGTGGAEAGQDALVPCAVTEAEAGVGGVNGVVGADDTTGEGTAEGVGHTVGPEAAALAAL